MPIITIELFEMDLDRFLEDFKLDTEDIRTLLERFKDYSRSCCTLSEIRSVMRMSPEELDNLAQSGGFKDTKDLMEYYKQETLDMCFNGIKASAATGDSTSKVFLKRYLSQYEDQKRNK